MPEFNTLHNELRLRVPNKPYEFYDDALRWAAQKICVKTALWKIVTTLVTKPDVDIYDIDLPFQAIIHSNLYIIQKGAINASGTKAADRTIKRPVNGFINTERFGATSDALQAFRTIGETQIQIVPIPKAGGITLEIHTAVKPTDYATSAGIKPLFTAYKDTMVNGALFRLYELNDDYQKADRIETKFNNGVSSIHVDVLKESADTPMKVSAAW